MNNTLLRYILLILQKYNLLTKVSFYQKNNHYIKVQINHKRLFPCDFLFQKFYSQLNYIFSKSSLLFEDNPAKSEDFLLLHKLRHSTFLYSTYLRKLLYL